MKVAVLCEYSGVVRDAFINRGHDAISCDILPTESEGPHIQGDCLEQDWSSYDLIIAHPPCTYLCNSGVRWLHGECTPPKRLVLGESTNPSFSRSENLYFRKVFLALAGEFFKQLLNLPVPKICIENPIPHKYAVALIGRKYDQLIQPYQFGHGETKATCLWLKGLPKLIPTNIVEGREARIHKMSPGPNRSKDRSKTYQGIADAMALQWG